MENKESTQPPAGTTQILSSITSALVGFFDMTKLLDQVVNTAMETLHAEVCSIFLLEGEQDKELLVMRAGSGFARKLVGKAKYNLGEGFTGYIAKHYLERGFNIASREDLENLTIEGKRIWQGKHDKEQWPSEQSEFRNCIALPLRIKNRCLGVIKVENKHTTYGNCFTEDDYLCFETIANVVALAIENAKLYKQIEKQLKTIAAKAAHRIHNQATNYDGIELSLAAEIKKEKGSKKQLKAILDRLKRTTNNLKRMTDEFKNYGKPLLLKRNKANINKIIFDEVNLAKSQKDLKAEIEIFTQLDEDVPNVYLDAPRFAEAIKELLRNSIKAISKLSPAKGNIILKTEFIPLQGTIEKESTSSEKLGFVKILIQDNGPGFPEKLALFEPFHSTDPDSTGLGLTTVKELVEAHAGEIKIIRGKGATIELELPMG